MPSCVSDVDALIQRQGAGARYDADNAPKDDLLLARRGTAFLARKITELSDRELYLPSRRQGQSRARLIAEISQDARLQATFLDSLRLGAATTAHGEAEGVMDDLDVAETLPARALRHLFQHSTVHLNVVWRDLQADHWDQTEGLNAVGPDKVRDLPLQRARKVWLCALDLGNGARLEDVPRRVLPSSGQRD